MVAQSAPIAFLPSARVRRLFERVADLPLPEQIAALRDEQISKAERAAVTALLSADDVGPALFDTSVTDWVHQLDGDPADVHALIGQRVGPYRIIELLGQGGSAVVFRATRTIGDAEQTVALKLLQNGLFSSESRRRFRREQAILTHLSHPNIARLIDGGISDAGIPYIAMELAEGFKLIAYADAHALDRNARLRLLIDLCRAVDAAHRALIVHRDLKPSNVLVTSEGRVKVLDFGIAKLLDDDEPATATQYIALTPGYAAPEQYRRGSVTTSADVYALGVIAAELLVGARLGPDAGWPDTGQEGTRAPARRRWRELDDELADIVRTTLASEPERRYSSAGHLADDIERYLRHEPIAVRAISRWYRARKFIVRHRGAVAATTLFVLAILVSMAFALWQAGVARQAAANTRAELERANAMRDFMFDAFGEAEPGAPRAAPVTVVDAVERAIASAQLDRTTNPRARIELLTRLSNVLSSQGKLDRARDLLDSTLADATASLGAGDALTLEAARISASNAVLRGDFADARSRLDPLLERVAANTSELRIRLLLDSATLATKERDRDRARREAAQAVSMTRSNGSAELLRVALETYGNVLLAIGEAADSIPVYEETMNLDRARFGGQHAAIAAIDVDLSRAYRRTGELDRAEASARAALAIDRVVYTKDDWRTASHLNALMMVLKERRDYRAMLETAIETLRIHRNTLGEEHPETVNSLNSVGMSYVLLEDYADALAPLQESLRLTAQKFGPEHWESAVVRGNYGYALGKAGQPVASDIELDHAVASFAALADPDPDGLATVLEKRVRVALDRGDVATALSHIERMEGALGQLKSQDAYWDGRVSTLLGRALLDSRRTADATRSLEAGRAALELSQHPDAALQVENTLLRAAGAQALGDHENAGRLAAEGRRALGALLNPPTRLVALASSLSG
ncbi:MAG: serine/threonine-protein kinase [Dokdonella sp.]